MQNPVIIIGSGISGLFAALKIADKLPVTLITKTELVSGSTRWAQGGIAAVLSEQDSFAQHIADTLKAGSNNNNEEAVRLMVEMGPEVIKELIEYGIDFDNEAGEVALTREGGHAARRIAHHKDVTGLEIERKLVEKVRQDPKITVLENTLIVDLVVVEETCKGVVTMDTVLPASCVLMASGGLGQIYQVTTNPEVATGDGYAMAYRAGAELQDMEFIQFHPTAFTKGENVLLLSEALRGEGALIVTEAGERFIDELAPRDVVAQKIYERSQKEQVYLDMTAKDEYYLKERFPYIDKTLKENGYNLAEDLIPIAPAAHFCCGGIKTDLKGKTTVQNLYAVGEVACTGVHGANRLASNSLLEAAVFAKQAAGAILSADLNVTLPSPTSDWQQALVILKNSDAELLEQEIVKIKATTKQIMQQKTGIVRNGDELQKASDLLISLEERLYGFCRGDLATESGKTASIKQLTDFVETLNMVQTAILVTEAAIARPKSLGCHFRQH